MGFFEYDRVRFKNFKYNFPTPEVNYEARKLIRNIGVSNKALLIEELNSRLNRNDFFYPKDVLTTAITIAKTE